MNNELESIGRKQSWPNLRYYPGICVEKLRKTIKNLSQDSWSLSRDLNSGLPEYKANATFSKVLCRKMHCHEAKSTSPANNLVSFNKCIPKFQGSMLGRLFVLEE
jgi:hypothetical protein